MVAGHDAPVKAELRAQIARECRGKLTVKRNGLTCKTRRYTVATGFGPGTGLGVYNNSVNTAESALSERYFLCKEGDGFRPAFQVTDSAFSGKHFKAFRDLVLGNMEYFPRWTRQQVVEAYTGPKKRVYQQALESLDEEPLSERDSFVKFFSKFEKQAMDKAGRGINPRSPRYNLELGTFLKHREHHYFDAINTAWESHATHTVIKGLNADEAAAVMRVKWDRFSDPVAVGLDASKFDMHVSQTALRYEHSFYTALYPGSKLLKKLLRWQLETRGKGKFDDGEVKFHMYGTRCSGDLNTSLGNCILMCGLIWAYCKQRGITAELANNGDDCVVIMEYKDLQRFSAHLDKWFKDKGFAMTVEDPVREFEQIEFCQTHPVQLQSGWRMIRNHATVLTKDPMCLVPIQNDKVYRKWLTAVGSCGVNGTSGCPVQEGFYGAFVRNGRGCDPGDGFRAKIFKNTSRLEQSSGVSQCTIDAVARASYCIAFGVTPAEQVALEEHYAQLSLTKYEAAMPLARSDLNEVYAEHSYVFGRDNQ